LSTTLSSVVGKRAALVCTTAVLFIIGLGAGATGTTIETEDTVTIDCGSLLTPVDPATAFKFDVHRHQLEGTTDRMYSERCEQAISSRQLPTYGALGLGTIGLFAIAVVFGTGRQFLPPS
jgi:hypothetical protein